MWDLRHICDLYHSSWQSWILNPLSRARDRTCILMDTSRVLNPLRLNRSGSSRAWFLKEKWVMFVETTVQLKGLTLALQLCSLAATWPGTSLGYSSRRGSSLSSISTTQLGHKQTQRRQHKVSKSGSSCSQRKVSM